MRVMSKRAAIRLEQRDLDQGEEDRGERNEIRRSPYALRLLQEIFFVELGTGGLMLESSMLHSASNEELSDRPDGARVAH